MEYLEYVKQELDVFRVEIIFAAQTVLNFLRHKDIEVADFEAAVKEIQQERKEAVKNFEDFKKQVEVELKENPPPQEVICPECGKLLRLMSVNIPQGRENVYGWRSAFRCFSCGYERFSTQAATRIARKLTRLRNKQKRKKNANST